MLRVSRIVLPERRFARQELAAAFEAADLGGVRVPGRKQVMDAHEVRGIFHSYLFMVGGTLAEAAGDVFEVPGEARPFVEALRTAYVTLVGDEVPGGGFAVEDHSGDS